MRRPASKPRSSCRSPDKFFSLPAAASSRLDHQARKTGAACGTPTASPSPAPSPRKRGEVMLRAALHLRVDKVLVFQLDATDRAGDRLSRRRREDFVLLQHSTADVVEVAAGIFFI